MVEAVVGADRFQVGAAAVGPGLGPLATASATPATAATASPTTRTITLVAAFGILAPRFAGLSQRLHVTVIERCAVAADGRLTPAFVAEKRLRATTLGFKTFAPVTAGFGRVLPLASAAASAAAASPPAAGPIILATVAFGPRGPVEFPVCHRPRRIGPFLGSLFDS